MHKLNALCKFATNTMLFMNSTRQVLLLIFCLVYLDTVSAQSTSLDSLLIIYEQLEGTSHQTIDSLNVIAKDNARSYPGIAQQFAEKALRQSQKMGYRSGEGSAHLALSTVFRTRSDLTKALENGFTAFRIFAEAKDSVKMAISLNSIGVYYKDLNLLDSSINYLYQALNYPQIDLKTKGNILNNIGSSYIDGDQLDSADKYYNQALIIRNEIKDIYGLGITYSNLGIVAIQKENDPVKAKELYLKSISLKQQDGDFFQMAFTYINLGNLHRNIEQFDEARKYYQLAVIYADSAEAKGVKSAAYIRWARSERRAGYLELAEEYDKISNELYIEVLEERQKSELDQLQASFDLQKKEQELVIEEQKVAILKKDRNLLLIQIGGLVIVIGLLGLVFIMQRSRSKKEKELEVAKRTKLESDLEFKNKELSSFTLNFIQKQEMMDEMLALSKNLKKQNSVDDMRKVARELEKLVGNQDKNDKEWEKFRQYFEQVHSDWFNKLKAKFDGLTTADLRLCALITLKLTIKESALILGIAPDSVKTSRYRLRKKLNLEHDQNLEDFLNGFDE